MRGVIPVPSITRKAAMRFSVTMEEVLREYPGIGGATLSRRERSPKRMFDTLVGRWDNPTMIVTLDAKRRLTVPAGLAPASPGDYFDASFDAEEDVLMFRRLPGKENWLAVLKACPVSPDDVPPRRRAPARRRKL